MSRLSLSESAVPDCRFMQTEEKIMLSQIVPFVLGFVGVVMVFSLVINVVIAIKGGSQILKSARGRVSRRERYEDGNAHDCQPRSDHRKVRAFGSSLKPGDYRRSKALHGMQPMDASPDLTVVQPSQPAAPSTIPDHWAAGVY